MNESFLQACRREPTARIPVWFMRQAGRSLPGYRKLRKTYGVLELAQTPELAAEVSLEPVSLLGVDAAILFADIMLLPIAMGMKVEIVDTIGPVVAEPIRMQDDLKKLQPLIPEKITYLQETITILRSTLEVPLIGFSGAPFTLASYLIEGKPTRTWTETKRLMYGNPVLWGHLMDLLSDAVIGYLSVQIDAGAQAVQLFDSWVGCLSPKDYRQYVLPYVQRIFKALKQKNVPRIHFATNIAGMIVDFANVDCEVIGIDWRVRLSDAKKQIGAKALQGNLDPVILLGEKPTIAKNIDDIVDELPSRTGYIFNLGHGVLPETDDEILKWVVEYVHAK